MPRTPKTKKHVKFICEKMRQKQVREVPGIGYNLAGKFTSKGIKKAFELLGRFLVFKKDRDQFMQWFIFVADPSPNWEEHAEVDAKNCFMALKNWCDQWL